MTMGNFMDEGVVEKLLRNGLRDGQEDPQAYRVRRI